MVQLRYRGVENSSNPPPFVFSSVIPAGVYTITADSDKFESTTATLNGNSRTWNVVALQPKAVGQSSSPGKTPLESSEPDVVRSAIDRIAKGSHQELPAPVQTAAAPGKNPGWAIENATGYQLHLYLSGPIERDYTISNGAYINIDLPAGSYRIAADVSSKSVIPFYAVRQLDPDTRWKSHFYIAHQ